MKSRLLHLASFAIFAMTCRAEIRNVSMDGYIGGRVHDCIRQRVMGQDVDELIEPFLRQDEVQNRWASEFWGKWVQGAMASYQYNHDPALYAKIKDSQEKMVAAQLPDGYIGDYDKEHQLAGWDVWGRKYTLLGLVKWYGLTGDKRVLRSACKLLDYTMSQIGEGKKHIYETGYYRGMPPCSILEPVMYMYRATKRAEYLDFAKYIAADGEKSHKLVEKCDVPVAQRFPLSQGQGWWSFENGQKAYEMMSCYVGMLELYKETGDESLLNAAVKAYGHIVDEEINICGSGAAMECWYGGRLKQHVPTIHTMETCVTFTWMQFCERLLELSHDSRYADQIERTMYNALMASMRDDASQIVKYTPLEGFRREGENQCDVRMNCCNANAPRAFAMIPRVMYRMPEGNVLDVNLYVPSKAEINVGKTPVRIEQVTDYPKTGTVTLSVNPAKSVHMTLNLRIPAWSKQATVEVNGQLVADVRPGTYCTIGRDWAQGDKVTLTLDMRTRMTRLDRMAAFERGPVVFARYSQFADGDVDECITISPTEGGYVDAGLVDSPQGVWLTLGLPALRGGYAEGGVDDCQIRLCDFASAGSRWDERERYRVWLPMLYTPSQPDGGEIKGYW